MAGPPQWRSLAAALTVAGASLVLGLGAPPLSGQRPEDPRASTPVMYWGVDVGLATLSSLAQGRIPEEGRRSWLRALVGGLAGGTLMYAGQQLVGSGRSGLRLLGLETVALGASVARNLGRGDPALSEVTFPYLPFYVRVRPGADPPLDVRLSVVRLASALALGARYGARPDWRESLRSGVVVLSVPGERLDCLGWTDRWCDRSVVGNHLFAAVAVARDTPEGAEAVLTHEIGHAAQSVRESLLFAVPAGDALLVRAGAPGRTLARWVVLDVVRPLYGLDHALEDQGGRACDGRSFLECEVEALAGRTVRGPVR
jgi:hypothetical protein